MTTIQEHRARLKFFPVDGGNLAYVDEGPRQGKPLVLLHGMPTSSWLYRGIIPRLTAAGLRVIAPDLLGFGASDKPSGDEHYAFDKQAARLVALMHHLGISRWTQVVHDLGGPWTWELADRHPETLAGLVVLNTTAYREGFRPPAMMKVAAGPMGGLIALLLSSKVTGPGQVGGLFRQLMAYPAKLTEPALHGYWLSMKEGTTRAFLAFARAFPWWFEQFDRYSAALRRLNIPVCTIWGEHDAVLDVTSLPTQFARDLGIPPQRQHVVDAGHFLQEDQPEEVANLLISFMLEVV